MRTIGIYVHVPFCRNKCPYCHFHSFPIKDKSVWKAYLRALLREIESWALAFEKRADPREVVTIYFGGGTPSLLPLSYYHLMLQRINYLFNVSPNVEVTLEANPEDLSPSYLSGLRELGVNRLSVGVQTLSLFGLRVLGRSYSSEEALNSLKLAVSHGFEKRNADLIIGYPYQSKSALMKTLLQLLRIPINHLSIYELEREGSRMEGWILPANNDLVEKMIELVNSLLPSHGFLRYEVSNYSKPGYESQHNLRYWLYEDWLGLGSGASGKVTFYGNGETVFRYDREGNLRKYLKDFEGLRDPLSGIKPLSKLEATWERLIMGLRTVYGVDLRRIPPDIQSIIIAWAEPYLKSGELLLENHQLKLNPLNLSILHHYLVELGERLFENF